MSVLVRRLGCLRVVYSALLRLGSNSSNQPHRVLDALPKREHSTPSAAWINPGRALGVPPVIAPIDTEDDVGPEKISENTYAHNLFLNSHKYANLVVRPPTTYAYVTNKEALEILEKDWDLMTSAETVSAVKKLSYNIIHNNKGEIEPLRYTKVFDTLQLEKLTNDELMTVMRHLVPFSNRMNKCSTYTKLCTRIDKECMMRFLRLPIDKTLYLCDIIYQMSSKNNNQYYSEFVWYSIKYLGNKPNKLSPQQLIQILFFLNIYRKPPINMYELEFQLERYKEDLSINEIAVAALGFFKTSTQIRSTDFLIYIIQRTVNEIQMVDSVSIAGIIKLVRYSMQLKEMRWFSELLNALTPYVPCYTLMSLAHIAQACGRCALYNEELMDRLIRRLNKELKTARIKDLERFLYTFSILNIDSKNSVYQGMVEELRATWKTTRAQEIRKFPYVLGRILGYLATQNIYPLDLIEHVMTPEFVNKTCNGNYNFLSREYLVLDYGLQVEVPEYNGPFLKPTVRNFLQKKYYDLSLKSGSEESTRANLLLTNVLTTCQELFNVTSNISSIRPLPYFVPQDIVFCLDERNQLISSEEYLSHFESNDIKRVNKENSNNVRWFALVMGHPGLIVRNTRNKPTGALAAKIRQLSIIGYTPIMISHNFWNAIKSSQEKCDYIKQLISR